eukprot:10300105-Ditylum_brightwellii.AAC.1
MLRPRLALMSSPEMMVASLEALAYSSRSDLRKESCSSGFYLHCVESGWYTEITKNFIVFSFLSMRWISNPIALPILSMNGIRMGSGLPALSYALSPDGESMMQTPPYPRPG